MNKEIDKIAKENALTELNNFKPTKERFKLSNKNSFIRGAKWQQERSYSEEEVHIILNSFKSLICSGYKKPYFDWFEQFKKK